ERLIVAHALEPVPHAMVGIEGIGVIPSHEWEAERRKHAEARLADALAQLEVPGEYVAVDGPVVSALVGLARERAARWMVIGTIGRTGLTRFLLGSVAEALVRRAPCSTLVVRLHRGS
ncbi:MAG: universal stress protein, partial [Deltaproteobacteria bacterium]|nr:universal stress protein [Kofleriaceae bacterium]